MPTPAWPARPRRRDARSRSRSSGTPSRRRSARRGFRAADPVRAGLRLDAARRAAPPRPLARARADRLHRRRADLGDPTASTAPSRPDPAAVPRVRARRPCDATRARMRGLPRVRYWQAWNEPNKVGEPVGQGRGAAWYRALVNGFAASVHTVPGNLVIAGGLSPFGISTAVAPLDVHAGPALHLRRTRRRSPTCSRASTSTSGRSTRTPPAARRTDAPAPNDVSVAELPEMKTVLDEAVRRRARRLAGPVRFWVTEFSWDSNPPDPGGVPACARGPLGGRGALPHVGRRREPRDVVHAPRPADSGRARTSRGCTASGPTLRADRPEAGAHRVPLPVRRVPADGEADLGLGAHADRRGGTGPGRAARAARRGSTSRPSRRTRPGSSPARLAASGRGTAPRRLPAGGSDVASLLARQPARPALPALRRAARRAPPRARRPVRARASASTSRSRPAPAAARRRRRGAAAARSARLPAPDPRRPAPRSRPSSTRSERRRSRARVRCGADRRPRSLRCWRWGSALGRPARGSAAGAAAAPRSAPGAAARRPQSRSTAGAASGSRGGRGRDLRDRLRRRRVLARRPQHARDRGLVDDPPRSSPSACRAARGAPRAAVAGRACCSPRSPAGTSRRRPGRRAPRTRSSSSTGRRSTSGVYTLVVAGLRPRGRLARWLDGLRSRSVAVGLRRAREPALPGIVSGARAAPTLLPGCEQPG